MECIKRHAPLVKTRFAHPPAAWMKQLDIADLQKNGTTIASLQIILKLKKIEQNLEISEINQHQKSKKQKQPSRKKYLPKTVKKYGK